MVKRLITIILSVSLSIGLAGFVTKAESTSDSALVSKELLHVNGVTDGQARNLQKLCKVWGFAKYTHKTFLTGQKNWDAELLSLIPVVRLADEDAVNDILYNWFLGLGDDGYDNNGTESMYVWARSNEMESLSSQDELDMKDLSVRMAQTSWISDVNWLKEQNRYKVLLKLDKSRWLYVQSLAKDFSWLHSLTQTSLEDIGIRQMANIGWVTDESYLGKNLSYTLARFHDIQIDGRTKAPVYFNAIGNSVFSNENLYENMDYKNAEYRLLGLFRLWNAIEYYFPYLDIIDDDWNELLLDYIPEMLDGTDQLSYVFTLSALASKLHDGHISFTRGIGSFDYINSKFGSNIAPVSLIEAEGRIVVSGVHTDYKERCPLLPGDIVLRVNGKDVNEMAMDMLQYMSYPNNEKALDYLFRSYSVLNQASNAKPMEIDVIRDTVELKLYSETTMNSYRSIIPNKYGALKSHELLDNNIGLINPQALGRDGVSIKSIMKTFAKTDGIIVDLRQYPRQSFIYELAEYLVEEEKLFVICSQPTQSKPGIFIDLFHGYSGGVRNPDAYHYEKKVVLLMDENTQSEPEFTIMSLRNGANVTVMGRNSAGADGNVVHLPLPGGITMAYTGLGVYTPNGGQTQRIGLSPDIYVERTIAGVKDSKDELMEEAIRSILGQKGYYSRITSKQ